MASVADIIVQAQDSTPQLIVEVKSQTGASSDWAAQMRRNLFAHLDLPSTRFFLLALPDKFYLWKDAPPGIVTPANYEVDARQVLRPYIADLTNPLSTLNGQSFELLVRRWLEDVVHSDDSDAPIAADQSWLVESELLSAIKQGFVTTQGGE